MMKTTGDNKILRFSVPDFKLPTFVSRRDVNNDMHVLQYLEKDHMLDENNNNNDYSTKTQRRKYKKQQNHNGVNNQENTIRWS